jgi:hypothetical protein
VPSSSFASSFAAPSASTAGGVMLLPSVSSPPASTFGEAWQLRPRLLLHPPPRPASRHFRPRLSSRIQCPKYELDQHNFFFRPQDGIRIELASFVRCAMPFRERISVLPGFCERHQCVWCVQVTYPHVMNSTPIHTLS